MKEVEWGSITTIPISAVKKSEHYYKHMALDIFILDGDGRRSVGFKTMSHIATVTSESVAWQHAHRLVRPVVAHYHKKVLAFCYCSSNRILDILPVSFYR